MFKCLSHLHSSHLKMSFLACAVLMQSVAHAQVTPAPLTAQERLDAIRQSLVDSSLQSPTRVMTTQWIDAQGSLRESSSFKNGMEVRGVRVMAYDRDDNGLPKAKLQYPAPESVAEPKEGNTPKGVLQKIGKFLAQASDSAKKLVQIESKVAPQSCQIKVGKGLKHVLSLNIQDSPNTSVILMKSLLPMVQASWIGMAPTSSHPLEMEQSSWRMVNALPAASMTKKMTPYEQALTANRPSELPWNASLKVYSEIQEAPGVNGIWGLKGSAMRIQLALQIKGTQGQPEFFEKAAQIPVALETSAWGEARLSYSSLAEIQQTLLGLRQDAEQWLLCQSVSPPTVTAVYPQQVLIDAGSQAGIRPGDEWLVANPDKFPAELISKDGAQQTLLAQVQSVSAYQSQLKLLAGPVQSVQPQWRAWPTEAVVKETSVLPKIREK